MAELCSTSFQLDFRTNGTRRVRMKIVAQLMGVNAISVRETGEHLSEKESAPKIQMEALRDMGALGRTGSEPVSNTVEIDIGSSLSFEGLNIVQAGWLENSMCVYLERPTDVAIIDTGDDFDIAFSEEEPPLRVIVVTDLENFRPLVHGDN